MSKIERDKAVEGGQDTYEGMPIKVSIFIIR